MVATCRLAALVAVAVVFASGCGSDDEQVSPTTNQKVTITSTSLAPITGTAPTNGELSAEDLATDADDLDLVGSGTADEPNAPSTTEVLDEFVASTTANPVNAEKIDQVGTEIVEAWWYPSGPTTYAELADSLEDKSLISQALADQWRTQGNQTIIPAPAETKIIRMWPVRVAEDNATFQISAVAEGETDETLTFLEFELDEGQWKAVGIE